MGADVVDIVFVSVGVVGLSGVFVCLGVNFYYAYLRLDELLGYLKNCPAVQVRKLLLEFGPMGRLFVLGGVISVLRKPQLFLRDGGADEGDLKEFPEGIKKKLLVLHRFSCFFILMLLGLSMSLELGVF